jgi:hypothetical protein
MTQRSLEISVRFVIAARRNVSDVDIGMARGNKHAKAFPLDSHEKVLPYAGPLTPLRNQTCVFSRMVGDECPRVARFNRPGTRHPLCH